MFILDSKEHDPYKIINPYIDGNIFAWYCKLEKEYTIARLRLEIFNKEFMGRN